MGIDLASFFAGGLEGLLKGAGDIISKFKADPAVVLKHQEELAKLEAMLTQAQEETDRQMALAQAEINKIEAASTDKFTSRWRPAVGWICALGLFYAVFGDPILSWLSLNFGWKVPPTLNVEVLTTCLFALLGFGGYRSFDKLKGTARK